MSFSAYPPTSPLFMAEIFVSCWSARTFSKIHYFEVIGQIIMCMVTLSE